MLFGILNGNVERGSIEQFYHNVDTVGAGTEFKARIDVLAVEETVAVVRVLEEGWGGTIDFKRQSSPCGLHRYRTKRSCRYAPQTWNRN